ncbi:MAG: hypothetical protein QQN63_00400 [Nitrosopumilus sp.]
MNGEPVYAEKTKEDLTPMGEIEAALETLESCAGALEELVTKCHTHLLGEYEFHPVPEADSPSNSGQLSSITIQVATARRQLQRCIEVMQSLNRNLS